MFVKIKKRWHEWRAKWTVDHTVDVVVDLTLLLIDVIASPVLIVVRLVRYVFGEWIADKLKIGARAIVHWYQRRHPVVKRLLLILFIFSIPFVLIILWSLNLVNSMYWEYNWGDK